MVTILMLPLMAHGQNLSTDAPSFERLFFQRALAERVPVFHIIDQPMEVFEGFDLGSPPVEQRNDWDRKWLRRIYSSESVSFSRMMIGADKVGYPTIYGVPILYAGTHFANAGPSRDDVFRMAISWIGAAGGALALKRLVRRPRPFSVMEQIPLRSQHVGAKGLDEYASFPSGHAALSFAIATTLSLQHSEWAVVIPSTLVASSISLSRIWLGAHYPTDVLTGAGLGIGTAVIVHFLVLK